MPVRTSSASARCCMRWSTGPQAFHGDSKMSTLAAILNQEPKPVSQLVPGIPRDLEKIINRCLRKDPNRRLQHMADLKVDARGTERRIRLRHAGRDTQPAVRPSSAALGLGGSSDGCRGNSRRWMALSWRPRKTASRTRSGPSHQLCGF